MSHFEISSLTVLVLKKTIIEEYFSNEGSVNPVSEMLYCRQNFFCEFEIKIGAA
jgi:hypothetical protein